MLVLLVQFPYVQTKIVNYLSDELSDVTGFNISLEKIDIDWFDKVDVTGLKVIDPEGNRLFYTQNAIIDFDVYALLNKDNRNIDEVIVKNASLYFTKISEGDTATSLNINSLIKRIKSVIRKKSGSRKLFTIDRLELENSSLTYFQNDSAQSMRQGLDYKHFSVENIYGNFNDLQTMSDTLLVEVESLSAKEFLSGLTLKNLRTDYHLSKKTMRFDGLSLELGNSYITDTVVFNYNSTQDLSDFVDKVTIDAHIKNTTINTQDLALFAPQVKAYRDRFKINGDFNGKVKAFVFDKAQVKFGNGTTINGKLRMTGLPDFQETFIDFDLYNSWLQVDDLRKYLSDKVYGKLDPFSQVKFQANFLGFPNDFVTKGTFFTNHGYAEADINLKINPSNNVSTYRGEIKLTNFDLGGYTQSKDYGSVSLKGNIDGSGLTVETADFKLNGHIDHVDIFNYNYKNIDTDARFTKKFFEGYLQIDDPNIKMSSAGSIDLRAGINFFNINAKIEKANLKQLNIAKDSLFIKSNLQINARGLEVDSIFGQAHLTETYIKYRENELSLDSLKVVSQKGQNQRKLSLTTNLIDASVEGSFDYTILYKDLLKLFREFKLNLQNNKDSLDLYYSKKQIGNYSDYSLNYLVNLKNPKPILDLVSPSLYISESTKIYGDFTSGYTSILSINSTVDTLVYDDNSAINNDFQINFSKIADSTNLLALAYVSSENQILSGIPTKDLLFEGIWNNNLIDFEFFLDQEKFENYAQLFGKIEFLPNTTIFRFEKSDIQLLSEKWQIDEQNQIVISTDEITVNDLKLYNNNQIAEINGAISKDPSKNLKLNIENVRLEILNTLLNQDLSGELNGNAQLSNYYQNKLIEGTFNINQLAIDNFKVGDIASISQWDNENKKFDLSLLIKNKNITTLNIEGGYTPDSESPLNLVARLNETQLKIIEPFFNSFFTHINGTLTGDIQITGKPNSPNFNGNGTINDAGIHVNYLNTDYRLAGGFYFKQNVIGFEDINITDARDGKAQLDGEFRHNNFKDFNIDIGGDFSELILLNTTSTDNNLFYGTGIGSGHIDFKGPIRNMNIIAQATTSKNTKIYIPIGDSENIQQEEYINFVSLKTDTTSTKEIDTNNKIDLRGLKLDFDLDITPDAYTEIIFDIKSGDIIRGRGRGDLKLQIDTKGDFNMFGDFNIQEGGYNFTLYNIINKEFEILPNSKISWYGDPYDGILDISATYSQLASFLPLLVQNENDTIYQESVELRRKYPVQVLLDIDGPLLSPNIGFDIKANNLPRNIQLTNGEVKDLEFEFLAFKNRIDEQELKRQVFSLIILRKFSPLQSFNTGGSITSSVSELFSNQLSYWVTQVDENLEIDVDLGLLDEEAFNTFQLRLSYTFLDGRLRVTRDGGFTNQANKADISSIAGDWTLEYLLTPDGKFKAKMYNRTNYNPINANSDNQNTITTGFSLIHTQSFNELKDLFKKSRDRSQNQSQNENPNDLTNTEGTKNEEDD